MTLHSLVGFIGNAPGVVEAFVGKQRHLNREVRRFDPSERVSLVAIGQPGSSLATWQNDNRVTAVFGSAVHHMTPAAGRNVTDAAVERRPLTPRYSDFIALTATDDGDVSAITGDGPHRFFTRKLPSGVTMVSSHLSSIVTAQTPAKIDRSYEDFFLGFGFFPGDQTMFSGVAQLPARSVWNSVVNEAQPLSLGEDHLPPPSVETGSDLLDLLLAALERQTAGTDDCAVLLGGFDSALVCALLRQLGKNVIGFTFDFDDERFNQPNIDLVRDSLGIDHKWVPIDPERLRLALHRLPDRLNSPGSQPHYQLHTVLASEDVLSSGFSSVLTGDGCDAIFLGYPTVSRRSALQGRLRSLPHWASRMMLTMLGLETVDSALGHVARTARSVLRASLLPYPASGHLPTQYFDEVSLSRLRKDSTPVAIETVDETRLRLAKGHAETHPTRLAFLGNNATDASRLKVDGSVMHTGVAQFTPFKDPSVVGYVNKLPTEALRPSGSPSGGLGKQYLIDTVVDRGLLPAEVVFQPKQSPSTSPIDHWYMNELRAEILNQLESLPFDWDRGYVEGLLKPKRAEDWYRKRVALSPHALQVIGLLVSYAAFADLSTSSD